MRYFLSLLAVALMASVASADLLNRAPVDRNATRRPSQNQTINLKRGQVQNGQFGGQFSVGQRANAGFFVDSVQIRRQQLLAQAVSLNVASPFEGRFQNGLSANDEAELRSRIRQAILAQRDLNLNAPFIQFRFGR